MPSVRRDIFQVNSTLSEPRCDQDEDPYPFQDFEPTLAQCFFVVILGYLVAKFQLLSAADLRGINLFIIYLGMPGIICITLADADFTDFRWELVLSVFLGKCVIFALVAGISLQINGNIGIAGLLAVFCVHANDLPVGNPLISALYKDFRPQMIKYLFFMPCMTVIFFVPVGTFMIEIHKNRRRQENGLSDTTKNSIKWTEIITRKELSSISQSLLKSLPITLATALGIILNFSFPSNTPSVLHQPIKVIADTVPGCVLSVLGFSMVRKERYLISSSVVMGTVLLAVKMFLTPIVMHTITRMFTDDSENSKLLSDFALLYGIISPATAIFLSGQEFRKPLAAMSVTLIVSSFLCFPTSYLVARYSVTPECEFIHYIRVLKRILFWVACFSIICDIFVMISILWKRKWNNLPYRYIICLALTQVATASGILAWNLGDKHLWVVYCQMTLYYGGEISGFIWIGTIAIFLVSADRKPTVAYNRFPITCFTILCGIIASIICAILLCYEIRMVYIVGRTRSDYEFLQLVAMTALQTLSISVVFVCLIIHSKRKHLARKKIMIEDLENAKLKRIHAFDNLFFVEAVTTTHYKQKRTRSESILSAQSEKEEADLYYEEVLHNGGSEETKSSRQEWVFRFFSLLVILLISNSLKLASNLYKLFNSTALEIMIPLEFSQSILFVGQGFFILLTFGIDVRTLSIEMIKWWRKIRYGKEKFTQEFSEVDEKSDEALFCNQFNTFYFAKCFQNLAKDRKWKDDFYKDCFWGHQLVDWLIQEGVAKDDIEAEELGQKLLLGGIISHVTEAHHFHDAPYLYFFQKKDIYF